MTKQWQELVGDFATQVSSSPDILPGLNKNLAHWLILKDEFPVFCQFIDNNFPNLSGAYLRLFLVAVHEQVTKNTNLR